MYTVEGELSLQSYRIQKCFSDLVNDTKSTLANHVPIESLRSFLSEFNFIAQTKSAPAKLFRDCLPELNVAETVDDAFDVIRPFYSFFNFELIGEIIKKYSTESDKLREQLEGYKTRFDAFCKRKVYECPAGIHGAPDRPKENEVHLVVKMKGDFKGFTLEAVNLFHGRLCEILGVKAYALHFIEASEGCIRLVFSLPWFLEKAIFPLSDHQKENLRWEGGMQLMSNQTEQFRDTEELEKHDTLGQVRPSGESAVESNSTTEGALDYNIIVDPHFV